MVEMATGQFLYAVLIVGSCGYGVGRQCADVGVDGSGRCDVVVQVL